MEQPTASGFPTAPIPFRNHTALLLCAALPYLTPSFRHSVELALKFLEFTETLRLFREFHSCGRPVFSANKDSNTDNSGFFHMLGTYITDLEGLLTSLSAVSTGDEKELIGMFLNLIRARNFYETYGDLLKSQFTDTNGLANLFSGLDGFGSFEGMFSSKTEPSGSDIRSTPDEAPNAPAFPANLSSMLNQEQKETLELLKSLVSDES